MDRVTEKEVMDDDAGVKAYAYADFSQAHNLFIDVFQDKFQDIRASFNDVVLELGCGSCDITRRFAQAYPDTGFHAVDASITMLQYAKKLNEKVGITKRVKLIETSLPNIDVPQKKYHAIISNSVLHHLHDPNVLWGTIKKYAKPYAHIFVMDLIRPVDEQTVQFLSNENTKNEPDILKQDFENSLRAAFTLKEVEQQLDEMDLGKLKVEKISDYHMIIYGVL